MMGSGSRKFRRPFLGDGGIHVDDVVCVGVVQPVEPALQELGPGDIFLAQSFDSQPDLTNGQDADEHIGRGDPAVPGKDVGIRVPFAQLEHVGVEQVGHVSVAPVGVPWALGTPGQVEVVKVRAFPQVVLEIGDVPSRGASSRRYR